ncbi:MAG TPA: NB-ARC domain-containing protein, partial [Allocoleopsis sp.]
SQALGESVSKTNFRTALERRVQIQQHIPSGQELLTQEKLTIEAQALTAPVLSPSLAALPSLSPQSSSPQSFFRQTDWGEAIDVSIFYGRTQELATLKQWLSPDAPPESHHQRCRVVTLLGMGGIGKSSLATKIANLLQDQFEFVIWRSLRNAPPLDVLLADLIPFLSNQQEVDLPLSPSTQISRLIQYLQQHRCLVVLDNVESILQSGQPVGSCRSGYEAYGELFQRISETEHQSCLLLTSREKPAEIAELEGETLPVRSLQLPGLTPLESAGILDAKGLIGTEADRHQLIEHYRGNPLALKIVATSIRELFGGDIAEFLDQGTAIFNGLRRLLETQIERLSNLEQQVMDWLAINREWTSVNQLHADILPPVSKGQLLEVLEALGRRSLIERRTPSPGERIPSSFTQQPAVMEYVTERLIEKAVNDIKNHRILILSRYALTKATASDYIRESQIRLILEPIATQLQSTFVSTSALSQHLQQLVHYLQTHADRYPGYAAANILSLVRVLQ